MATTCHGYNLTLPTMGSTGHDKNNSQHPGIDWMPHSTMIGSFVHTLFKNRKQKWRRPCCRHRDTCKKSALPKIGQDPRLGESVVARCSRGIRNGRPRASPSDCISVNWMISSCGRLRSVDSNCPSISSLWFFSPHAYIGMKETSDRSAFDPNDGEYQCAASGDCHLYRLQTVLLGLVQDRLTMNRLRKNPQSAITSYS